MWVLPNSIISPFVQGTGESTLDSSECCRLLEASVMWRSKPSQSSTWLKRLSRVSWMPHLFGRILRPSMHDRFEEKWISSLEDSHASRSHTRGKENLQKIRDICSHTLKELSANAPQGLYSLKTWKELSLLNLLVSFAPTHIYLYR